jgi:uncharacterized protein (TIGR03086 family)
MPYGPPDADMVLGMDPQELDRRVLESIDPILAQVTVAHLDRPTPCSLWSLADLLRHMVGSHRGFAAAAGTDTDGGPAPADGQVWDGAQLGPDPYETYRQSAQLVTEAFAAPELMQRRLEVWGYGTFTAPVALKMHAVDFLAHGWDVAESIGIDANLDEELCTVGLEIASQWPVTPKSWGPNGAFRERLAVPANAPAGERLMGLLGRSASWRSR